MRTDGKLQDDNDDATTSAIFTGGGRGGGASPAPPEPPRGRMLALRGGRAGAAFSPPLRRSI